MTDVGGFENDSFLRKFLKTPFLRWPSAGWFQPIARIGPTGDVEWPLAANDGSGPIPADSQPCKQMPKSYIETPEFCDPNDKSRDCKKERKDQNAVMNTWLIGASPPLPEKEPKSAKAWMKTKGSWHPLIGGEIECQSSYPRTTLVSDFVAQKTGELFLFVNDAMPLLFLPNDTHYKNNRGSATITLMRAPLFPPTGRTPE